MQKKLKMVEAVVFFGKQGICREMLLPEFEAVLDGVVGLPDLADQQVRLAYLLISPRLEVRAAVFFYLDFDEDGAADPGWSLPLRQLSERAAPGIDLGAGPIRLVSRSQCPEPRHQMHLWDPELQDLLSLRDAAKRNQLGLLCEEETLAASRGLQMADGRGEGNVVLRNKESWSDGQRQKTARLIKRQRLHIRNLSRYLEEAQGKLKQAAERQTRVLQVELRQLREQLSRQQELSARLEAQLQEQAESLTHAQAELAVYTERERMGQEEMLRLRHEHERLAVQNVEQTLERLASLGLTFVVYHPGAGHLTIPLQDIARYQESPIAYAAAKCSVSEEQYRQWLRHFQQPVCECELSGGKRCALPIDRVDNPQRFVAGESNCCARHKSGNRLRNAG